jgi:thiamine pyrophosphate-dependent acetolactate synthase large subunit-like protein
VDYRRLAEAFQVYAEGRVEDPEELGPALRRALRVCVEEGRPALVEVLSHGRVLEASTTLGRPEIPREGGTRNHDT